MKSLLCFVIGFLLVMPQSPRTFTDGKGHTISVPAKPMRIASVVLGVDENLADLVDASRIVAMTDLSKDLYVSNIADRVPAGKIMVRSEWQKILDAKPDLILAATYTPTLADPLIARKLPVYQFSEFDTVDALLKNFEILGQLVGEEAKAKQIIERDRALLANAAKRKPPTPTRAVYFSEGFLFGRGTVPSEVLTLAGLTDAVAGSGYNKTVQAAAELIERLKPDVIFFGEDSKKAEDDTRAMFMKPEFQKIPAVRNGRVYSIPGKHITTTSHNIVHAVEDVQTRVSSGASSAPPR